MHRLLALLVVLALSLVVVACQQSTGPKTVTFDLVVENGKLNKETLAVKEGDSVVMKIKADTSGEFHLHGYDIELNIGPEQPGEMSFAANATGKFKITFHGREPGSPQEEEENEEEEPTIAFLEVQPR